MIASISREVSARNSARDKMKFVVLRIGLGASRARAGFLVELVFLAQFFKNQLDPKGIARQLQSGLGVTGASD